jgi:hypothetical protein
VAYNNIGVTEVSGQATTSLDSTTKATGTDSTSPYNITAGGAIVGNQIAFYGVGADLLSNAAWTAPTGYTSMFVLSDSGVGFPSWLGYKLLETGTPSPGAANTDSISGAGAKEIFFTLKEASGPPITPTFHGKWGTTPGNNQNNATSFAFTPVAGTYELLGLVFDGNSANASDVGSFTITDTFGDTGGTAWTLLASSIRSPTSGGQYREHAEVWGRKIGTGPSSGTITATISILVQSDAWLWADSIGLAGQAASPVGVTTGNTNRQAAGPTTYPLTLGGTPNANSFVYSIILG